MHELASRGRVGRKACPARRVRVVVQEHHLVEATGVVKVQVIERRL
jgi:hypothetical protein